MKQPKSICKDCKFYALIREPGAYMPDYFEACCTHPNFQPSPYISPVSGEKVKPRFKLIWCDKVNKGDCAYWEQRGNEPVKILNDPDVNPCILSGCLIYIVAFILMFVAAVENKGSYGFYGLAGFILAFTLIGIGIFYDKRKGRAKTTP